ncbi:MAG: nuclear transport factor 2 family protein [Micropruina sp.]|nr:MAG: nuclear transport factor 2 family protein [Micropruina sp.]
MLSFGSDLVAIHQLLSLHGHLVDGREFDRFDELFTNDVVYDVTDMGQGIIQGLSSLRDVSAAFVEDERNPVGHHLTNVIVEGPIGDIVTARSKGLGVLRDGCVGTVTYVDRVVRTADGWRIAERRVLAGAS